MNFHLNIFLIFPLLTLHCIANNVHNQSSSDLLIKNHQNSTDSSTSSTINISLKFFWQCYFSKKLQHALLNYQFQVEPHQRLHLLDWLLLIKSKKSTSSSAAHTSRDNIILPWNPATTYLISPFSKKKELIFNNLLSHAVEKDANNRDSDEIICTIIKEMLHEFIDKLLPADCFVSTKKITTEVNYLLNSCLINIKKLTTKSLTIYSKILESSLWKFYEHFATSLYQCESGLLKQSFNEYLTNSMTFSLQMIPVLFIFLSSFSIVVNLGFIYFANQSYTALIFTKNYSVQRFWLVKYKIMSVIEIFLVGFVMAHDMANNHEIYASYPMIYYSIPYKSILSNCTFLPILRHIACFIPFLNLSFIGFISFVEFIFPLDTTTIIPTTATATASPTTTTTTTTTTTLSPVLIANGYVEVEPPKKRRSSKSPSSIHKELAAVSSGVEKGNRKGKGKHHGNKDKDNDNGGGGGGGVGGVGMIKAIQEYGLQWKFYLWDNTYNYKLFIPYFCLLFVWIFIIVVRIIFEPKLQVDNLAGQLTMCVPSENSWQNKLAGEDIHVFFTYYLLCVILFSGIFLFMGIFLLFLLQTDREIIEAQNMPAIMNVSPSAGAAPIITTTTNKQNYNNNNNENENENNNNNNKKHVNSIQKYLNLLVKSLQKSTVNINFKSFQLTFLQPQELLDERKYSFTMDVIVAFITFFIFFCVYVYRMLLFNQIVDYLSEFDPTLLGLANHDFGSMIGHIEAYRNVTFVPVLLATFIKVVAYLTVGLIHENFL